MKFTLASFIFQSCLQKFSSGINKCNPYITSLSTVSPLVSVKSGGSWEAVVPPMQEGVKLKTYDGREFKVKAGDHIEITASGCVDIGRIPVGPDGEFDYKDNSVDSPYKNRVGGLEMWIGDNKDYQDRYFIGRHFDTKVRHSGIPTFRVIESVTGYNDGNIGAFKVTIRKK